MNAFLNSYDQLIGEYEDLSTEIESVPRDAIQNLTKRIFSLAEEFDNLPEMEDWEKSQLNRYRDITERYGAVVSKINAAIR